MFLCISYIINKNHIYDFILVFRMHFWFYRVLCIGFSNSDGKRMLWPSMFKKRVIRPTRYFTLCVYISCVPTLQQNDLPEIFARFRVWIQKILLCFEIRITKILQILSNQNQEFLALFRTKFLHALESISRNFSML